MEVGVGEYERGDIDKIVDNLLLDLGNPEPPLSLDMVREALRLDLRYYSSSDHGLVDEIAHRVKVGAKQLILRPGLLLDALKKAKLSALWMPDSKRIMIDDAVPKLKHRWIEGHEIGHSLIPWHKEAMFGDTEFTLDPTCHEIIEAEANYAASQLLFMRGRFSKDARDLPVTFKSISALSKRYGNTITTSLWRTVEERDAAAPVFGLVSCHPRYPDIGSGANGESIRYFIRSSGFRLRFANVTEQHAFKLVQDNVTWGKRGTILDGVYSLVDANGDRNNFKVESFCNGHALLTIGLLLGPSAALVAAA
jgi:hypothetical protein